MQNAFIKELDPLVFTLHLGSMKIFFNNIETEEKTTDGEILGELDQVLFFNIQLTILVLIFNDFFLSRVIRALKKTLLDKRPSNLKTRLLNKRTFEKLAIFSTSYLT